MAAHRASEFDVSIYKIEFTLTIFFIPILSTLIKRRNVLKCSLSAVLSNNCLIA